LADVYDTKAVRSTQASAISTVYSIRATSLFLRREQRKPDYVTSPLRATP
jgi:hypothetical protein